MSKYPLLVVQQQRLCVHSLPSSGWILNYWAKSRSSDGCRPRENDTDLSVLIQLLVVSWLNASQFADNLTLVKFQSTEIIVFDCFVQFYSCCWVRGFLIFFLPFCSVIVEVGSLLHLVLVTGSSFKMSGPYPLNVNMEAQNMFRRSCSEHCICGYAQEWEVLYPLPMLPEANGFEALRMPLPLFPCEQTNIQYCHFWVLRTTVQRIIFPLGNNNSHLVFKLGDWQGKGIIFWLLNNKYFKSSRNVYQLVSVPGTWLSISNFYVFLSPLCSLGKVSNLPKVTQSTRCGWIIQIQVN